MAKCTSRRSYPRAEAQGEWDQDGARGADAPAPEARSSDGRLAARVRLMMVISGLTTLIAIAAVIGVIGYRVYRAGGSGAARSPKASSRCRKAPA